MTQYLAGPLLAAGLALFAGAAAAEQISAAPAAEASQEADAVLSAEDLDALSGGTGVHIDVVTGQTLSAINTGNSITGQTVGSGQINMASGALSGFDGVGNFVMNTGHNNNLQSSLNVTIVLAP